MVRARFVSLPTMALLGLSLLVLACGGGGGGGGGGGNGGKGGGGARTFSLEGASFARPIFDLDGELSELVNPASLYETDPLTGAALPGFPRTLNPQESLQALSSIDFFQILDPLTPQVPLLPRNGALVLDFSGDVDEDSLGLGPAPAGEGEGDGGPDNYVLASSALRVVDQQGALVEARAWVDGSRVVLVGLTPDTVGWPASPLVFDQTGAAVEDPDGVLRVVISAALRDAAGVGYTQRTDGLGSSSRPLPFNPGNSRLDAIVFQTDSGAMGFNGFLPDLTAPRLVRSVVLRGSTLTGIGAGAGVRLEDAGLSELPNTAANDGSGEWAGGILDVVSAGGETSSYRVAFNENLAGTAVFELVPGQTLDAAVAVGDAYTVRRTEYFEPLPPPLPFDPAQRARITVDPENFPRDLNDPEDLNNHDLRYFIRIFDEDGVERLDRWDPSTDTFLPVDPRSTLRLTFSEPMDGESFRAYETLFVTSATLPRTEPGFDQMRLGRTRVSKAGRDVFFEPVLEDQLDPSGDEYVGFGGTGAGLRLVMRVLPEGTDIQSLEDTASPEVLEQFTDLARTGVLGITDLGGRSLGLPVALLDQSDPQYFFLEESSPARGAFPPALDFVMEFETQPTDDPDYGVVVHRFMGQATTSLFSYPPGIVHDQVTAGVEYSDFPPVDDDGNGSVDRRFIYGPQVVEVGLDQPGRLTGSPGVTIEHVMDNFNPPAPSTFASPNGEDFLVDAGFGTSTPLASPYGARFMHQFRAGDASPSQADFAGVTLDLVGLAWAPQGPGNGAVQDQSIDGMEILVGLSATNNGFGPNTNQTNGIPSDQGSGLVRNFDCNLLDFVDDCDPFTEIGPITSSLRPFVDDQPGRAAVVKKDTPYIIKSTNLFKPLSAGSSPSFNLYLDYPDFNTGVDPFFGKEDVFSYPYDSRFPMIVELRIGPNAVVPPAAVNFYRFTPGILTSVLPRFRTWSIGQDPLAHSVPAYVQSTGAFPFGNSQPGYMRAGEGGPLLVPGCFDEDVAPPEENNGQPVIDARDYVLPPSQQPMEDYVTGRIDACDFILINPADGCIPANAVLAPNGAPLVNPSAGCLTRLPLPNSDWTANFYWANGMFAYPLPYVTPNFINPTHPAHPDFWFGPPGTAFYGYGPPSVAVGPDPALNDPNECVLGFGTGGASTGFDSSNEPSYQGAPQRFGDNSRYFTLWKYQKRVSVIESPTVEVDVDGGVRYLRPIVDPPLTSLTDGSSLGVEVKAGTLLDFSVSELDSGFVNVLDEDYEELVTGLGEDRVYIKFRASFGIKSGGTQSPSLDTVVIPFVKVDS